jgi:sulfite reductase beta subunit-like hemoprotein
MYRYDSYDQRLVDDRVAQFRDQTRRFLAGELTEDEFRPLRLQNGLYIQKHAPMLRVSIPYGVLSSRQLRKLAHIGRKYDRGYGHFTTRQNLQFNWPRLEDAPEILAELATVEMHAIQTSGNCVRNITTDHFAGVAADELVDPRPYAELIRQWAALNPVRLPAAEVQIAVGGASEIAPRRWCTTSACTRSATTRAKSVSASWSAAASAAHRSSATRSASGCRARSFSTTSMRSCGSTTASAAATTSTRRGSRSW